MLIFLERTPEFEPLRHKFQLKFENYFKRKSKIPLNEINITNSASSFSSNTPPTPKWRLLTKLKNHFWFKLSRKYAFRGMTNIIETLTNKIQILDSDVEMKKKLIRLHFDVGIQNDIEEIKQLIKDSDTNCTQLLYIVFHDTSCIENRKNAQSEYILHRKPKESQSKKNEIKKEQWSKQRTDKVSLTRQEPFIPLSASERNQWKHWAKSILIILSKKSPLNLKKT